MKKAQILSAIALAFALGVTPVIATANTVSAYTAANADAKPPVQGSATQADVENAIAAIKANPTYTNMVALEKAMDTYYVGKDYADFTAGTAQIKVIEDLVAALEVKVSGSATYPFGVTATNITDITGDTDLSNVEMINALVKKANVKYYDVVAKVQAAVDDKDDAAFRAAVAYYNATFGTTLDQSSDATISNGLTALQTNFDDQTSKLTTWANYVALYNAVDAATTAATKYTNGKTAMVNALQANGVLNANGLVALNNALKNENVAIVDLVKLVADLWASPVTYTTNTNNYKGWIALANEVKTAAPINMDSVINYNEIITLATQYKAVTNNNTQSVAEIAATLVGYKAPAAQNTISEGPVTVTGPFSADYKLSVVKSDKKIAAFGDAKYAMWDINVVDKNNNKVNVEGSVMVTINVPEGFDAAKSSVYFVTAEGKVEKLAARVENGKMVFTTSHFSLYAIVEDNGKNFGIGAPDTGIVAGTENSASTTVAMVAGVATALTAAGAGVVAYRNARRSTRK